MKKPCRQLALSEIQCTADAILDVVQLLDMSPDELEAALCYLLAAHSRDLDHVCVTIDSIADQLEHDRQESREEES
jgi:hypothetical protein